MEKNLPANARDVGSIPGSGRFLGGGNGTLLQHSCLDNSLDRGTWWAIVHIITKSWTQLTTRMDHSYYLSFAFGSVVKNPPASARDMCLIPESIRSPGEGNSNPFQYSCLENPMNRGAWQVTFYGVPKELCMT